MTKGDASTNDTELPIGHRASVLSLQSGHRLASRISDRLGIELTRHEERDFEDGEHKIRPLESVRGRDVYLVQSLYSDGEMSVNDRLVRMLFFLGALRDAGAGRLTAVAPYLCYSRKDRRTKSRDPVSTRYVATLFEAVGIDRMVTVDVHNEAAYENAFRVRAEHLTAAPLFVDAFVERVEDEDVVVVSPDAGGVKRAESFRQGLERRLERSVELVFVEKFRSEGVVRGGAVVGDVEGKVAIIIDDLISSGGTLARAAEACKEAGASAAFAAATHGVFSAETLETIRGSELDRVLILDTIPPGRLAGEIVEKRFDIIDSSSLLASAIRRLHTDGRLVELNEA